MWLRNVEKLDGPQLQVRVGEMRDWLHELPLENIEDGFRVNSWGWCGRVDEVDNYLFTNAIWFQNTEDLLAFKLKFGIG